MYEEDLRQGGIFPDIGIWRFVLQSLFDLDDLPDIRDRVRQVVPIRELQGQKVNPRRRHQGPLELPITYLGGNSQPDPRSGWRDSVHEVSKP